MSAISDEDRPRLGRGVRLRWDPVRETQMLLRPEGAVALNAPATAILELCTGERTTAEIIQELQARYGGADLAADVHELLNEFAQLGLVVYGNR